MSGPIRVLANNDVPKGAACLRIRSSISGASHDRFTSVQHPLLSSHIETHRLTYPNRYLTDSWNGWKNPVVLDADDVPVAPWRIHSRD